MTRNRLFALLLSAILLCSCNINEMVTTPNELKALNSKPDKCYQKALSDAFDLIETVYPEKFAKIANTKHLLQPEYYTTATLAEARPEIQQLFYSKSTNSSSVLDTLLYIVNFGNDDGFVAFFADTTLSNNIIAITENGTLTISDLTYRYEDMTLGMYASASPKSTVAGLVNNAAYNFTEYKGDKLPDGKSYEREVNKYKYTEWINTHPSVSPLVAINLHQHAPFNLYCPKSSGTNTLVGCGPIALLQLISVIEHPATINGYYGNWNLIKQNFKSNNATRQDSLTIARWLRELGRKSNVLYGNNSTVTTLSACKNCLASFGRYKNINVEQNVTYSAIYNMVSQGLPVFCGGYKNNYKTSGHFWTIDGYLKQKRDVLKFVIDSYQHVRTEYRELIHCNMGWNGNCNGYYHVDCFNTTNNKDVIIPTHPISNTTSTKNYDYSYKTEIITYSFQ